MKIAVLTTVGDHCGIAAYTRALITELQALVDLTVMPISVGRQDDAHYASQAEILNSADVIHIQHEHSFWGGIMPKSSAFWALRYMLKKPLVVTAHTTTSLRELLKVSSERRLAHRLAKEFLLRRIAYRDSVETAPFITSRCIVHTDEAKNELVNRGAKPEYLHVLPAGVPAVKMSSDDGTSFRQKHGLSNNRIISLFGFIAPNKGYELMFQALQKLPENVVLVVAGGVRADDMIAYEAGLRGQIESLRLRDRVVVTGYLTDDEIASVMSASDVVAAPHLYATGSYSVMVPLAYGKAIAASDLACFREIFDRGQCLELFKSCDLMSLTNALDRLLNDSTRRGLMENRAREYSAKYSWQSVAHDTVKIYEEALADELRLAHHSHSMGKHR